MPTHGEISATPYGMQMTLGSYADSWVTQMVSYDLTYTCYLAQYYLQQVHTFLGHCLAMEHQQLPGIPLVAAEVPRAP